MSEPEWGSGSGAPEGRRTKASGRQGAEGRRGEGKGGSTREPSQRSRSRVGRAVGPEGRTRPARAREEDRKTARRKGGCGSCAADAGGSGRRRGGQGRKGCEALGGGRGPFFIGRAVKCMVPQLSPRL